MPLHTSRFRFEYRVLDWCEALSRGLCGQRASFFVGMRDDGTPRRLYFGRADEPLEGERKTRLAEAYTSWLLYMPADEPGTGYLEWLGLPRAVAERWLGRGLEPSDLVDVRTGAARADWPADWRVHLR
jgi:hypothetical protein